MEYFPKRIKLKVVFTGLKPPKEAKSYLFETFKEANVKIEHYKRLFKPAAVSFVLVQGMIQVISPPPGLKKGGLLPKTPLIRMYSDAPKWSEDDGVIYGRGFEDTLYIANKDYGEIVKLKGRL